MIVPMGNRVLVLPNAAADTWDQAGQLAKPDTAKERPQEGTVLGVGPNVTDAQLQPGSKVFYGKFSGAELKVDGVELVILLEEDLLGKVLPEYTLEQLVLAAGCTMPKKRAETSLITA